MGWKPIHSFWHQGVVNWDSNSVVGTKLLCVPMDLTGILRGFATERPRIGQTKESLRVNLDPIEAAKIEIKTKLANAVAYRTSVLANVKTLAALEPEDMRIACETMEEQRYAKGEDIIRQGEKGDALYLLQTGSVFITRKVNPRDPSEAPTVLARLPKNTHFGEIALLTDEPRSATVTAGEDCLCCIMKKKRFDEIVATSNAKQARHRYNIGKSVLSVVPVFSKFSPAYRDIVLEVMQPLHFPPGSYICKEGQLASSFFIMLDGTARCTIRDVHGDAGDEAEIGKLGGSSYFGEMALLDPSHTRNCNVISIGDVSCMVLQRSDFATIYRSLKEEEGDKQKAMMKKKSGGGAGGGSKSGGKRQVSAFAKGAKQSDEPQPEKLKTLVARMVRFITESTWISMYSKMYRAMVLDRSKIEDYGKIAWELMLPTHGPNPTRNEAIKCITENCLSISQKDPGSRQFVEQAFLCGMLRQPNKLKNEICASWHPFQYTDLCKTSRIQSFKPLDEIVDVGAPSTTMYLVLRGCVRTWRGSSRADMVHDEDLVPGDVFGSETCIAGNHTSTVAARAISNVHVACFDESDFINAVTSGSNKITSNEKIVFLKSLHMFKRTDDAIVAEIANILEQVTFPRRSVVTRKGDVCPNLRFIYSGYAETVVFDNNPPYSSYSGEHIIVDETEYTAVAKIERGEMCGESGFIAAMGTEAGLSSKRDSLDFEHHDTIAATMMEVLVLKPRHFHLMDKFMQSKIVAGSRGKVKWRNERILNLKQEKSRVKQMRKTMTAVGAAFAAAPNEGLDVSNNAESETRRRRTPNTRRSTLDTALPSTTNTTGIIGKGLVMRSESAFPPLGNTASIATTSGSSDERKTNTGDEAYNYLGNLDLDDVPRLLDGDFDPFMVIEAQRYEREVKRQTRNMRYLRLPRAARGRGRTVESEKEPGFVAKSLMDAATSRPSTGAGFSVASDRYRSHLNSRGRQRARDADAYSRTNYSETSQYTSFQPLSGDLNNGERQEGELNINDFDSESLMRPNSAFLRGSSLIPPSLSYIDSEHAHSRSNSPVHSRPQSRK